MSAVAQAEKIGAAKTSGLLRIINSSDHSSEFATSGSSSGTESTSVPDAPKGQSDTLLGTGTHGRKVHRRMRSRFQKGTLQKAGNWVIVRFRIDTPDGQRSLTHEKVCQLINGKPTLSLAEQRRRAAEIIEAAGVNNTTQIKQNVLSLTFAEQAERFLKYSRTRNRNPVSTNTAYTWRTTLDKWLLPNLGEMLLQDVNNRAVKELVEKMVKAKLAAKSIDNYIGLVKLIVASAIDENGEEIYPRKWNHEFIDLPEVKNQHKPSFTAEQVPDIIARAEEQERMLLLLVASTGLRLGELLGLSIQDISDEGTTITVAKQATRGGLTNRLKTHNAYRIVDVHPDVAAELVAFIGDRTSGLVFASSTGEPLSHSNLRNRLLYPILEAAGIDKAAFHAFRRFRVTHLRKKRVPEDLIRFWLGHGDKTVTDGYSQLKQDTEYRKAIVQQAGIGFEIPPVVQNVQKSEKEEVTLAA